MTAEYLSDLLSGFGKAKVDIGIKYTFDNGAVTYEHFDINSVSLQNGPKLSFMIDDDRLMKVVTVERKD